MSEADQRGNMEIKQGWKCCSEGSTAAGRPAVLGTKAGDTEPQLWGTSDSWAEDRNRSVRTVSVCGFLGGREVCGSTD